MLCKTKMSRGTKIPLHVITGKKYAQTMQSLACGQALFPGWEYVMNAFVGKTRSQMCQRWKELLTNVSCSKIIIKVFISIYIERERENMSWPCIFEILGIAR